MVWLTDTFSPYILHRLYGSHKTLDVLFRQNIMFIKVCVAFVFGLKTLKLIDFTKNLSIKGSLAQNQRPHELLWMLWFDYKEHLQNIYICGDTLWNPVIPNLLLAHCNQFARQMAVDTPDDRPLIRFCCCTSLTAMNCALFLPPPARHPYNIAKYNLQ